MNSIPLLIKISILSHLVPLLVGIKHRKSLLWMIPLTGFIFDVLITTLKRGAGINSFWLGNPFLLCEFIVISLLYQKHVLQWKPVLFYSFVAAMCAVFIINTLVEMGWDITKWDNAKLKINKSGASIFYFTYILYAVLGFYAILKVNEFVRLEQSWLFWTHVALIIYGSGDFFMFLSENYMKANAPEVYRKLWNTLTVTLNTIKNLLLGVALFHFSKSGKEKFT